MDSRGVHAYLSAGISETLNNWHYNSMTEEQKWYQDQQMMQFQNEEAQRTNDHEARAQRLRDEAAHFKKTQDDRADLLKESYEQNRRQIREAVSKKQGAKTAQTPAKHSAPQEPKK